MRKPRYGENKASGPSHVDREVVEQGSKPRLLTYLRDLYSHFLPIRDDVLMNHRLKHPWVPRPASVE